ncbi:MAG: hypothetical protein IJQ38_04795 [Bacteroidaceae bacterium]|nr:hypothetical protein [Bacteroidaceae bacterium]
MAKKKYCSIYRKLVQGDGDMIGHIAYSLYKAEKVQYIEEYKQKNSADSVPDSLINEFTAGRESKKSIEHYRGMAETILQDFMGGSFDEMSGQVISQVTDSLTTHIDEKIVPKLPQKESWWHKFWNGCLQSIGGAIALSLLVWLFANVVGQFSLGNMKVTYSEENNLPEQRIENTQPTPTDSLNNNVTLKKR